MPGNVSPECLMGEVALYLLRANLPGNGLQLGNEVIYF
jgi:hypothetical protein